MVKNEKHVATEAVYTNNFFLQLWAKLFYLIKSQHLTQVV